MDLARSVILLALAGIAACGADAAAAPEAPPNAAAPLESTVPRVDLPPRARPDAYWTQARLASLEEGKDAFVPAPNEPPAPSAEAPSEPDAPSPLAPTAEPQPSPSSAPPGTGEPERRPSPAPVERQPQEQRFLDALVRIDESLKEGRMSIDEAVVELEKILQWTDLTAEQREILEVNIHHLEELIRERDRPRLDK